MEFELGVCIDALDDSLRLPLHPLLPAGVDFSVGGAGTQIGETVSAHGENR